MDTLNSKVLLQVNQIHPSASYGDAIGNELLEIRQALRDLGYKSNIYAQQIDPKLQDIRNYIEYKNLSSPENILLIHFSMAYERELMDFIKSLPDKKILIYHNHNVTPPHFFHDINSQYESHTRLGREQLKDFKDMVCLALADSEFNRQELNELGFKNTHVLPFIIDFDKYESISKQDLMNKYNDEHVNIIFVGRIAPNKKIEDIIKIFAIYNCRINIKSRLFLVGSYEAIDVYYSKLKTLISELDLSNVNFVGHVSHDELISYYKLADVFVTMSEHEGFCVPLLESMFFNIPIIAFNSSAIADTLGDSGILINEKNYEGIAEIINLLVKDKEFRSKIIKKESQRLSYFDKNKTEILLDKHITAVYRDDNNINIQIEGTFEDSYSLSIVNRNLAKALDERGYNVSLKGCKDYKPGNGCIIDEKTKTLSSKIMTNPDFVIRNIYPPRINNLKGRYNLINFYWEESIIPSKWAADFNKLDGIIVASNFVKKVLIDSGVCKEIAVIPPGLDIEIFSRDVEPMQLNTKKKFLFFNVSSGFPRKGTDVLVKAYLQEFSINDDVCLILKTFPNFHNKVSRQIKNSIKKDSPEIIHIDRDLSASELAALYKRCDCLVSPTRGEGFGLPIAEAMFCRKPVIVTNYSGQMDFCNEENSYLIDYRLEPSKTHLRKEYGLDLSLWAEPDLSHLKKLMRYVYENRNSEEVKRKVDNAHINVVENLRWDTAAKKTIDFLNRIQSSLKVGIVTTWNTRCGIAEYSRYLLGPLSQRINFTILANIANKNDLVYEDGDNVVRCWYQSRNDYTDLYRNIKKGGFEIVHFQYNTGFFSPDILFDLISRLKQDGIKTLVTFHSTLTLQDYIDKQMSFDDAKTGLNQIDRIWVHTQKDSENLSSMGATENVILIPQGTRVFEDVDKDAARKGVFFRSKIIATFGFLLPHKGVMEIIKSIPMLKKRYHDILFLVVSALYPSQASKDYLKLCKDEVNRLKLNENVVFFSDFLEDYEVMELLHASDFVILPYKETKESSSAAIRFALSSNRPVIVTDNPIFDEFSGGVYRIPKCTPDTIAKGIIDLNEDANLQCRLVEAGKRVIDENSWLNISKKYENLIYELTSPPQFERGRIN